MNCYLLEIEKDNERPSKLIGMVCEGESMQYLMTASALTLFSLENQDVPNTTINLYKTDVLLRLL
jgi:hypothetical protein